MTFAPVPNQATIQTAVRAFLVSILPPGIPVVQGQQNRVPEPAAGDFVVFTEMFQRRLATNIDTYADVSFTGSIAGNVLTVSAVAYGTIAVGAPLYGPTVTQFTTISGLRTGVGGVGTYLLSESQTVASGPLAAGVELIEQSTEITFQVDVHGISSADNAQTISTLWRDDRATLFFYENYPQIGSLLADDPRQTPFRNDQDQIEFRWTITATLQANQTITAPQEFASQIKITIVDAQQEYPAI